MKSKFIKVPYAQSVHGQAEIDAVVNVLKTSTQMGKNVTELENKVAKIKQGHAVFFASFIRHRVKPVIRGTRKSLVMWFGGTPFK